MQGDSIYAEISPDAIPFLQPQLEEGKIIILTKVTVDRAKPGFKAVQNPYMIKLNRRTQITEATNPPSDFPKYTFSLVPFERLPDYTQKTDRFLGNATLHHQKLLKFIKLYNAPFFADVIGRIIGVSNLATAYTSSGDKMKRRVVQLQDLKYISVLFMHTYLF